MRKSRFSEAQIIGMLKQAEAGRTVTELCREQLVTDGELDECGSQDGVAVGQRHLVAELLTCATIWPKSGTVCRNVSSGGLDRGQWQGFFR